ncbi:MAG: leukotriene A4 hydrolase C-terminal domain-containing protein, partial [Crocinitomicaceae bacterium]|nr:leukotriene A4 hydrolase C-terminal domain-containing protein [Crocinitomicaceae bacterium]
GMTQIAYVKGAFFLKTLEEAVGRKKFDSFLKSYFKEFAFKTITTEHFVNYLNSTLLEPNNIKFNTNDWIYKEGLPSNCVKIQSARFDQVQLLADRFAAGEDIFAKKVTYVKVKGRRKKKKVVEQLTRDQYITQEWQTFIRKLPADISVAKMQQLDKSINFKNWGNSEIMTEWYVLGINNGYEDIKPNIEKFLIKVGRRKYLAPIYKALTKRPNDLEWAKGVFDKAKGSYHFVSKNSIEEMLYK